MSRQFSNPAEQSHTSIRTTRNIAASERPSAANNRANPRVIDYGQDPVEDYRNNPKDPSLLYGLEEPGNFRNLTKKRLKEENLHHDDKKNDCPPRTIDEYNHAIGITRWMPAYFAHRGIFQIRRALEEPQRWKSHLPDADDSVNEPESLLGKWRDKLVENKQSIGLYDLGDRSKKTKFLGLHKTTKGLKKIEEKNRFNKNLEERNQKNIKAENINLWLRESNNVEEASRLASNMDSNQEKALSQFIQKEFFRRTSKLGIDFVTDDLDAKVHFNTAGKVNSNDANAPVAEKGLLKTVGSRRHYRKQKNNRAITVSELRHIKKRERQDNNFKNKINYYAESNRRSELEK